MSGQGSGEHPRKRTKINATQQPGDSARPTTFILCHENESMTAAYLGYEDTTDLRHLAVTWPVLRAALAFHPVTQMRGHTALTLLGDRSATFANIAHPEREWPLDPNDTSEISVVKKSRRLAAMLHNMKDDLATMQANTAEENQELQRIHQQGYTNLGPLFAIALLEHNKVKIKPPIMDMLESEGPVEPYNRCFVLLRYFRHQMSTKKGKAIFEEGPKKGGLIDKRHIPVWMRPKPTALDNIPLSEEVAAADKLPPRRYEVLWAPKFDHPDLENALPANFYRVTRQDVSIDPRVFRSIAAFRDHIRRQYECSNLGMQISMLRLIYGTEHGVLNEDIMTAEWDDVQDILRNPAYEDISFDVGFLPRDEEEEEDPIFEESKDEPMQDLVEHDVSLNVEANNAASAVKIEDDD